MGPGDQAQTFYCEAQGMSANHSATLDKIYLAHKCPSSISSIFLCNIVLRKENMLLPKQWIIQGR